MCEEGMCGEVERGKGAGWSCVPGKGPVPGSALL